MHLVSVIIGDFGYWQEMWNLRNVKLRQNLEHIKKFIWISNTPK